eukprot:TRINITY_DN4451_c0_g1_i4.p2 TRINITY_DN4451_c0_g1~~TRINITY_DN4451_c0_g1_i4.p2  ORF type:complete len:117 (-),score=7.66 TRINITY_DN4451_c0_g1_i4:12-362(-)
MLYPEVQLQALAPDVDTTLSPFWMTCGQASPSPRLFLAYSSRYLIEARTPAANERRHLTVRRISDVDMFCFCLRVVYLLQKVVWWVPDFGDRYRDCRMLPLTVCTPPLTSSGLLPH